MTEFSCSGDGLANDLESLTAWSVLCSPKSQSYLHKYKHGCGEKLQTNDFYAQQKILTLITIESSSSFPAKIILTSFGFAPILGAILFFTSRMSHSGSSPTDRVFPVLHFMCILSELSMVGLPKESILNAFRTILKIIFNNSAMLIA